MIRKKNDNYEVDCYTSGGLSTETYYFKCPNCQRVRYVGEVFRCGKDTKTEMPLPCIGGCKDNGNEKTQNM